MAVTPKSKKGAASKARPTRNVAKVDYAMEDDLEQENGTSQGSDPMSSVFKSLEEGNKKVHARQNAFLARKAAIFEHARKSAHEVVKQGVFMIDEIKAKVAQYATQEISFDHYFQDVYLPSLREKEYQQSLIETVPDLTEQGQVGPRRAQQVEAAVTMVDRIPAMCKENEHNYSKTLKADLKAAKKKEKDAEDAAVLIENLKKTLGHTHSS